MRYALLLALGALLDTESGPEHVWLESPEYSNGSFHGKLGNAPLAGPLELGDRVSTPATQISDWMAVRDGVLFGGYTVFVARSRMSADERKAFDESLGIPLPESPRSF